MSQENPGLAAEPYVESRLTHSGAVIMVGERAYKLKRPLRLGFLDFSDVARCREICLKELSLNRGLAPDVYLGLGGIDDPVWGTEPVVVMWRRPPARVSGQAGLRRRRGFAPAGAPARGVPHARYA